MTNETKLYVYPYNSNSASAKDIADALGVKRMKRVGSSVQDGRSLVIVNWGATSIPFTRATVINKPNRVHLASNKLRFFELMAVNNGNIIPAHTTSYHTAQQWLEDGHYVCSRAVLAGNSGEGLIITNVLSELPNNSPLYTKYIKKTMEFRVHVIDGVVQRVQKKVYPSSKEKPSGGVNWKIRNHENGFIFQVAENAEIPRSVLDAALTTMKVLELDFGGVDIIWNKSSSSAYILEVNTAPGIEGRTLEVYGEQLHRLYRQIASGVRRT